MCEPHSEQLLDILRQLTVALTWYRPLKLHKLLIAALIGLLLGSIFATENGMRIYNRPDPNATVASALARATGSDWEPARIAARDGTPLEGWLFTPRTANGDDVIVLHGVGDTREGMMGHARLLLEAGYTVLAPDARGHGSSGGTIISYGVREAGDVHDWCDWLLLRRPTERLYGLGRSMGAAILLESLPREPHFRAVVAECPFPTFEEIAYYRLGQVSHLPRAPLWPIVHLGFAYAQLRYGIDLYRASPAEAVRHTAVPILLIHGMSDTNIPPSHSVRLHALNPATQLWLVPGAGHLEAPAVDPARYTRTVIGWFQSHP